MGGILVERELYFEYNSIRVGEYSHDDFLLLEWEGSQTSAGRHDGNTGKYAGACD